MILNAAKSLTTKKPAYKKSLQAILWTAYLQDLASGDATTSLLKNKAERVHAEITAKSAGILAGIQEADWLCKKAKVNLRWLKKEGQKVKKGDRILRLVGRADRILAVERTLLNTMQRLSGIATKTVQLKAKIPKSIELLATRKTLWGDLDKRAVAVGGGATHRLNLADAILIKENHLLLINDLIKTLTLAFRRLNKVRFIEIEVENESEIQAILPIYRHYKSKYKLEGKFVIMLDNFTPAQIKKVAPALKKEGIIVEVSGGINEKNIKKYALRGVSAISTSAITMNAPTVDLSLKLIL